MDGHTVSVRLAVWFEGVKWRIAGGRRATLHWWYLVLAGVPIAWIGSEEIVAPPWGNRAGGMTT
ncbi:MULTISPECIES: hypothetical protein [unclassified Bifidobacterium]|uniref:hypothetical protein n=1 Tax=unclassified Bifidobacterium TaxID=2608897 RepID=UPI00112E79DF|nr:MULTISPECIES: hypothetical protein [unclassified Bifidobacterium]TPF78285.1 hypothetical protein BW09_05555 [Bifidobacterium sp. UTCIF-1]TPF79697.1 hypothetical protein BW08_08500 [Bifidobacterium sp. UTCIF-24]TPF82479.1 hypothetical protein BW12_04365 [Bifidobacterium sp. UTCIF-3]TPF84151.1 hypothetical protein BW07_06505 [Bifidobacterium sp. UTCIF-36]TPF88639.1 hypothetical protein BW10_08980 [Bifidobacterium sp. UTBIF-56]